MLFNAPSPKRSAALTMLRDNSVCVFNQSCSMYENLLTRWVFLTGYFRTQIEKAAIPMRPSTDFSDTLAAPLASEIDELAERSESLEQRIASLNDSYESLKKREVELSEWRWVLREAGGFFDRVSLAMRYWEDRTILIFRNRPTPKPKIFANPLTMTRRLCFATLNSMLLEAPMVILMANRAFLR